MEGFPANPHAKHLRADDAAVSAVTSWLDWTGDKEVINSAKSVQIGKSETSLYMSPRRISLIYSKLKQPAEISTFATHL